ncbi:DNA gyrase subunit B [Acidaminobacter hydrogenoformans DSM 2784]|uniref:DNA topoisomerase (ATP-hydrolyzing) n=1 Tax=Acidaminobacter hydrogenoformans DSM 2784 TaxID=1120920 RepID=A0A1G5S6R5_9FIRM|nr:DNA gyrase subunit B [Acidaminobacter hydrogenoformans DSM 2784]
MVKQTKAYDNESITSLKGADRVRKRPSVIFGSDGLEGAKHTFFEVLSNSIDEAREGHGKEITVIRHADRSISVIDKGRGIPVEYNKAEARYNWELIFCELYAGGKYNNISGETYEYSLGLNGLGLCATQYSSEYMDVEIVRDGHLYALRFEKGENVGGLYKELTKQKKTGSTIKWRPDLDVFTDNAIPSEYFEEVLKRQAIVNKGLRFIYQDEKSNTTREYIYDNGIVDYLDEIAEDKRFTQIKHYSDEGTGRDRPDKPAYKVKVEMAFCFNNEVNLIEYYHNSSYLEHGGSPDKAVKSAFTAEIDQYIKKQNKYQKNEKKISFVDVQDSLVLVVNSFSTMTSYENQTKKAVTNKFIQDFMTEFIRKKLEVYLIENAEDAERIIDQILINKRSREKAESTRLNLKKALSSKTDLMSRVKKFVDCRTKDLDRREIYIVEGDSALGACKLARDSEFQALMPIRGKILNCLKADYDKIFKSEIIIDLIRVLGCGVEIKSKHAKEFDTFDLDSLNWDKVVICTDADVDGFQIRTLVLSMIYALMPTLIHEGKVFIAETPLYEISTGKKTLFAYSDKEKTELLQTVKGNYTLQRSKGLGENDPEMMWLTTMSPDTRRLIRIEPEDIERTERMFEVLLGDDLEGRKEFIEQYGYEYLDQLDLS